MRIRKFKKGDRVEYAGNEDVTVIGYPYNDSNMVDLRVWDGARIVGTCTVCESDVKDVTL